MDDQRLIRLLPPYPPTTAKETLRQKMIRQVQTHNFNFFSIFIDPFSATNRRLRVVLFR
jgi:hypothetical protein